MRIDPVASDGLWLKVRGNGARFEVRLQDIENEQKEIQGQIKNWQAAFDAPAGQWVDVRLPLVSFSPVSTTEVDHSSYNVLLNTKPRNVTVGFVYGRRKFNDEPNAASATSTSFVLDVAVVGRYRDPRPSFVLVSSAGAERINRQQQQGAEGEAERAADIPIVRLNPQVALLRPIRSSPATHFSHSCT